jgi:hypothetical protein
VDWTAKALSEAEIGEDARQKILQRNAEAMISHTVAAAAREKAAA